MSDTKTDSVAVSLDATDLLGPLARLYDAMPPGSWIEIAKPRKKDGFGDPYITVRSCPVGRANTSVDHPLVTEQGAKIDTRTGIALATSALAAAEGV